MSTLIKSCAIVILNILLFASHAHAADLDFSSAPNAAEKKEEIDACFEALERHSRQKYGFCEIGITLGIQALVMVELGTLKVMDTGLIAVSGFTIDQVTLTVTINKGIDCSMNPGELVEMLKWSGQGFKSKKILKKC